MKKSFKIAIPEPCHENWQTMTSNEKGRFCDSCSKTVVDFTQMGSSEIQNYLINNKRVCGHIKQSQLNSINLRIPSEVFQKKMSPIRFFSLALLIVMGSSIMSYTGQNGTPQKINSVEIIDSTYRKIDTSFAKKNGIIVQNKTTDSIIYTDEITLEGEMITTGMVVYQKELYNHIVPFNVVDTIPEFINTPKHLTSQEKKELFNKKINSVFSKNLKQIAKHHKRIHIVFEIDSLGLTQNIKTRPTVYKKEVGNILTSLPKFIPAKHRGKNVAVSFALPVLFKE